MNRAYRPHSVAEDAASTADLSRFFDSIIDHALTVPPPEVNGLDRSNVGNAETQGVLRLELLDTIRLLTVPLGFTRDIGAAPDDLNLAVSLFFITFVLLQPPSAAVGRWLGAKHWITAMMASASSPSSRLAEQQDNILPSLAGEPSLSPMRSYGVVVRSSP